MISESAGIHRVQSPERVQVGADVSSTGSSPFEGAFRSNAFIKVLRQAERFARAGCVPILIQGESGTGKTQLARHLHRASARAGKPFQTVVLSALDDSLANSELFGHVSGAFTDARSTRTGHFASANGGTLFLDEIGKASLAVQQKLLHAVEYREIRAVGSDRDLRVDVRIIAATNVSLDALVREARFLPDLEARLSTFRIRLPSLRERRADIPILVEQCIRARARDYGYSRPPMVSSALVFALQRATWTNNVRQLDATVQRILVDAEGADPLTLDHCIDDLEYLRGAAAEGGMPLTVDRVSAAIERAGSVTGAARLLGVDRTTIHRFRRKNS